MKVTINGETVEVADASGAQEFIKRKLREQERPQLRFIEAVNEAIELLEEELYTKRQYYQDARGFEREEIEARIERLEDVIEGLKR